MPAHKHAALIKAWADGAQIQVLSKSTEVTLRGKWLDVDNPGWYDEYEYRIKPEPKPDIILTQNYIVDETSGKLYVFCLLCDFEGQQTVVWTIDGETRKIKSVELVDK